MPYLVKKSKTKTDINKMREQFLCRVCRPGNKKYDKNLMILVMGYEVRKKQVFCDFLQNGRYKYKFMFIHGIVHLSSF